MVGSVTCYGFYTTELNTDTIVCVNRMCILPPKSRRKMNEKQIILKPSKKMLLFTVKQWKPKAMVLMRHCLCQNNTELRVGGYGRDSSIQEVTQEAMALEISLGYRVGLFSKKRKKKKREELEGDSV